jgi:hypothetical protein
MVAQVTTRNVFEENVLKSDNLYYLYYRWTRRKQESETPFIPMRMTSMTLEEACPVYLKGNKEAGVFISAYLVRLIHEQKTEGISCMMLPSVARLTEFFNVPEADVKDAFTKLQKNGYELTLPQNDDESVMLVKP